MPYGVPKRLAPYEEYDEAFRFTAFVKLEGRSGRAGVEGDEADMVVGLVLEEGSVDVPGEEIVLLSMAEFALAAPALSQGFGGDGEAIVLSSTAATHVLDRSAKFGIRPSQQQAFYSPHGFSVADLSSTL